MAPKPSVAYRNSVSSLRVNLYYIVVLPVCQQIAMALALVFPCDFLMRPIKKLPFACCVCINTHITSQTNPGIARRRSAARSVQDSHGGLTMRVGSPLHGVRRWSEPAPIREVTADYRAVLLRLQPTRAAPKAVRNRASGAGTIACTLTSRSAPRSASPPPA